MFVFPVIFCFYKITKVVHEDQQLQNRILPFMFSHTSTEYGCAGFHSLYHQPSALKETYLAPILLNLPNFLCGLIFIRENKLESKEDMVNDKL